ncbi:S-layer homology domain-containing protein [Paenibacillus arenilitoris]|uniref:S-layer homology domain-containing protein n=1 Tax=Paenibacillus arenilitoris TaxID=2772299 RepID=A0A927CJM5_9BACL|nr:S-layer homology domain-containing protein [Paenibacillus arenilitoris]MBD2869294.1 S-layer homology domain-containing protein [Paenibacillus arenilitoris]
MKKRKNAWISSKTALSIFLSFLMAFAMMPQAMNAEAAGDEAEAPAFSVAPGLYEEPQTVALSTTTPEAVIRYTVDGSEPNASSPVYSEPIWIDSATQIRAYAESEGGMPSERVEGLYVIADIESEWSYDFSSYDSADWQFQDDPTAWSVAGGQFVAKQANGFKAMIADLADASPRHFVMEADINPYSSLQNTGFVFRVTDPGAGADTMSGYFVGFAANGTLAAAKLTRDGSSGKFALIHRLEGANAAEVTPNALNRLKVVGLGASYYIYLNGKFQFTFTDTDHAIGTFGLRAWHTAGDAAFDNVKVTALSSDRIGQPEPDLSSFALDSFDSPSLGGDWSIFQEDAGKWSLSQHPGYLTLQTTATDLYQANNTLNNVFLREAPENFEIVTSLHAPILRNHQQAGLIVMQDADNFYRLGQVWNQNKFIETGYEKAAAYTRGNMADHPGGLQVKLKIRKFGNQYTSYYWSDGGWVQAAETATLDLQNIKIGVYGNNNVAPDYPINVRVDYFGIKTIDGPSNEEEPETPEVQQEVISVPNTGMDAWYKMDEPAGSFFALDSSGNYRHSFITYGTWLPEGGVRGGALSLNGTSDRIALNGPSGTFMRNEFEQQSTSLWFKANKTIARQVLFERGGNVAGLAIQLNNNKLEAAVVNASNRHVLSVDFTDTSSWHHVLVSFDKGDFKLYLDGELAAQKATGFALVASALNVGGIGWRAEVDAFGGTASGAHFEGLIDDVRLFPSVVVPKIGEVSAESIAFDETELSLNLGEKAPLTASLLPIDATNSDLIWESSDPSVVRIDTTEALIANLAADSTGTATISASTVDGGYKASVDVTVTDPGLQSVKLNPVRITLPVGVDYVFAPAFEPSNAKPYGLKWSSDHPEVASIDANGKLTTLAPGHATIKLKSEEGDVLGTSAVTVEEATDSEPVYLMSYFRSDIAQTGKKDEYLHLAYSRDGLKWYELNDNLPVVDFNNPLRDPFIAQGEDGIWRLMFTAATVNGPNSKGIFSMLGYAESRDLINWTNYRMLDVMKAYKDRGEVVFNSWAPEWSYDPVNGEYVIYWSSTVGTYSSGDNKHYYATTKDWKTFSDAKPFFAPEHKTIDATLHALDADERIDGLTVREKLGIPDNQEIPGNTVWMMFYKDETHENQGGMRNRQTWSAEGVASPETYRDAGRVSEYVTPLKTEGASIFKVGDQWHMMYDYWWAGKFGLKTTPDITDPSAWSEENMDLRIPFRARHSGMSIMGTREMWNLINHFSQESLYSFLGGAEDASGRGNDGEAIGSPSFADPDSGDAGYADFDGSGDAIKLEHLDDSFYNRTVSMWVKANETEDSQMLYHEGNRDGGLALKIEGDQLIAGVSKEQTLKTVSTGFDADAWRFVTVVYEEGILKLYVDGVKQEELQTGFQPKQSSLNQDGANPASRNPELYDIERGSLTATIAAGAELDVFGDDSSASYYGGRIGQTGLYTLPLFDQDIEELYDREKLAYNSTANSDSATFDKYKQAAGYADVTTKLKENGNTLIGVTRNGTGIGERNYSYDRAGHALTIKKAYLAKLGIGEHVFTIDMSEGVDPTLTVTIGDSTPKTPPNNGGGSPSGPPAGTEAGVLVNGVTENIGKATTEEVNGQRVTTIKVDEEKLQRLLEAEGEQAVITIPSAAGSQAVIGELSGRIVQNMGVLKAVLELRTERAAYTLPAERLNIEAIAERIGIDNGLENIKIRLEISELLTEEVSVVEDAADREGATLVVPPLHFKISAVNGDRTEEVSSFGAYVKRTIALPEGIDPERMTTGAAVEADGTLRHVPTKIVTIDGKYYAQINSLTNSIYSVVSHPFTFEDVESHWAKNAVNNMGARMIVSGTGESRFSPDRDITRAEFAAIAVRGLGLRPESGMSVFTDVKPADWFGGAVQTAYEYGIIAGYEDGSFRPHDKITREQAMLMVSKAMAITGLPGVQAGESANRVLEAFSDVGHISNWALSGVGDSVSAGIVSGRSDDELAPKAFMTRAEVATIMQRLLQKSGLINE